MRNELLIAFKALQLDQGASGIVTGVLPPPEARASTISSSSPPQIQAVTGESSTAKGQAGLTESLCRASGPSPCPATTFNSNKV